MHVQTYTLYLKDESSHGFKDDNCLQEPTFWMKGTATLTRLQAFREPTGGETIGDDLEHRNSTWCLLSSAWVVPNMNDLYCSVGKTVGKTTMPLTSHEL